MNFSSIQQRVKNDNEVSVTRLIKEILEEFRINGPILFQNDFKYKSWFPVRNFDLKLSVLVQFNKIQKSSQTFPFFLFFVSDRLNLSTNSFSNEKERFSKLPLYSHYYQKDLFLYRPLWYLYFLLFSFLKCMNCVLSFFFKPISFFFLLIFYRHLYVRNKMKRMQQ